MFGDRLEPPAPRTRPRRSWRGRLACAARGRAGPDSASAPPASSPRLRNVRRSLSTSMNRSGMPIETLNNRRRPMERCGVELTGRDRRSAVIATPA